MHPVRAGGARAASSSTPRTRTTPTSPWSASCATTRPATCAPTSRTTRSGGRSRSIPQNEAALDFATRGQPETYAISPSGVVAAAKYGPMSSGELETFLAAARALGMIRRWGPWIALGVVVAVVLAVVLWPSGDAVERGARPRPRDADQVPGVPGPLGRRQPGADVAGDPRRHQAADRGRAERRADPPGLRRQVRRVDPARPAGLRE